MDPMSRMLARVTGGEAALGMLFELFLMFARLVMPVVQGQQRIGRAELVRHHQSRWRSACGSVTSDKDIELLKMWIPRDRKTCDMDTFDQGLRSAP